MTGRVNPVQMISKLVCIFVICIVSGELNANDVPNLSKSLQKVPAFEPLSRYGNRETYEVRGKIYQVMRSSYGFHQQGLASWYGLQFHKNRTSSGEPYDMHAMTAAHKTLPLPTWAIVKNLSNGREIVVRINDRGPFHEGRIIDLSYASAQALGMANQGVAKVEVKALTEKNHPADFFVQVSAYKTHFFALRLQKKLEKLFRIKTIIENLDGLHIVRCGPFKERHQALSLVHRIELAKIGRPFIVLATAKN